jgi:hypothetical protein
MLKKWTAFYGAHPLQLLLLVLAGALAATAVLTLAGINPQWPHIAVWFLAAVVGHDLVAFPLYAAADGLLVRAVGRWGLVNYLRVPTLAGLLTFVLFLPGIIRQGAGSYYAATGLTQQPFRDRWLLLVAGFFALSALVLAGRTLLRLVRTRGRLGRDEHPVGTEPVEAARSAQ